MTKLARIKCVAADLVVVTVKAVKSKGFITARCPETHMQTTTFYYESKLACKHYEYRRVGTMHGKPTRLACAGCTGRHLTPKERAISA